MSLKRHIIPFVIAICCSSQLFAQPSADGLQSGNAELEGPKQGDRWTYELHDNITDEQKDTITYTVVEVTGKEIVTRANARGQRGQQTIVFDHNWNRIDDMVWKFSPNDGEGVPKSLEPGKEWRLDSTASNMTNGTILRGSMGARVTGKETVTTKAGTFDTLKIDYKIRQINTKDPTKSSETTVNMLYAPTVNRWVQRHAIVRVEGRLRDDTTLELVDYSRKP